MQANQAAGHALQLNGRGFLADFDKWNREVAEVLAAEAAIELTDCHWTVIDFLREYYRSYEVPPAPRAVIQAIGDKLTLNAPCTKRTLESLFPAGGCRQACRIAGLPNYYCHGC